MTEQEMKELRAQHRGFLDRNCSPGQQKDSTTILDLLAALEAENTIRDLEISIREARLLIKEARSNQLLPERTIQLLDAALVELS